MVGNRAPQGLEGLAPGGLVEVLQEPLGWPDGAHEGEGVLGVGPRFDGFVHLFELDVDVARVGEDGAHMVGIGQAEHARGVGRGLGQGPPGGERLPERQQPLVVGQVPPHQRRQPCSGPQRPADVGESGDGIVEEHDPEAAHGEVEDLRFEGMHLGVGLAEADVGQALVQGSTPSQLEHLRREVDPQGRGGGAADVARRASGAAADVEDVHRAADRHGVEEAPPVPAGDPLVAVGVATPVLALGAVPGGGHLDVGDLHGGSRPRVVAATDGTVSPWARGRGSTSPGIPKPTACSTATRWPCCWA